jgi:long-subunit fatty acid transport protein
VIPLGAGIRYTLNARWSLNAELDYRFSFSDYIDGFSKSANPNAMDAYYSLSAGLNYHFLNKGIKCPPLKY